MRLVDATPQFLLDRAKRNPNRWIFPKRHIEFGESHSDAAIREVREEAGVEANVTARVGSMGYFVRWTIIDVEFFLLEYSRQVGSAEHRELAWRSYPEALNSFWFRSSARRLRREQPLVQESLETCWRDRRGQQRESSPARTRRFGTLRRQVIPHNNFGAGHDLLLLPR